MGLLTRAERKSVEPLAAVTAPSRVSAQHQSLLHFVAQSAWSDARVLAKVLELTLPSITAREPVEAWIIDDTSFPKKGKHSVGVARQYSGHSQAGQLPGRSVPVARERRCELPDRLQALPAEGVPGVTEVRGIACDSLDGTYFGGASCGSRNIERWLTGAACVTRVI